MLVGLRILLCILLLPIRFTYNKLFLVYTFKSQQPGRWRKGPSISYVLPHFMNDWEPLLTLFCFVKTRLKNIILASWSYLSPREDGTMSSGVDLILCQLIMQSLLVLSCGQFLIFLCLKLMQHGRTWHIHSLACFVHPSTFWSLQLHFLLLVGDLNWMKAICDMVHCLVKQYAPRIWHLGWNFFRVVTKLG